VETSTVEVEDDAIIELEAVADVDLTNAEDEDDVIVMFAPVTKTDAGTVAEDEDDDELVLELITVSDAEEELEIVAEMASARTLPSVELLELDCMIEELEVGWLDSEDELERTLLEDIDVDIPMLLADSVELPMLLEDLELSMLTEDDVKVERTLLDKLDELVLDFDVLLLVKDVKLRLEDGVGEVDRIFEVELDRDEVEDDGAG
jgi:hypothetical protein